ncbi:MAG TPA: hypothetical protein VFB34_09760 [Chloroflexota bacterium]|nr:hypothetical protein [Chloroflexota bacterium]
MAAYRRFQETLAQIGSEVRAVPLYTDRRVLDTVVAAPGAGRRTTTSLAGRLLPAGGVMIAIVVLLIGVNHLQAPPGNPNSSPIRSTPVESRPTSTNPTRGQGRVDSRRFSAFASASSLIAAITASQVASEVEKEGLRV